MDINNKYEDKEYMHIVSDIIDNNEFNKTKNIIHHGLNRFDHCMRVSYYSYKVTKALKLDYKEVARAGLLHDFFYSDNSDIEPTKRLDVLINHPKYALINAKKYFDLSLKEENIIASHMFPVSLTVPRYIESWIVDLVDNVVAICEVFYAARKYVSLAINFLLLVVINYWR